MITGMKVQAWCSGPEHRLLFFLIERRPQVSYFAALHLSFHDSMVRKTPVLQSFHE